MGLIQEKEIRAYQLKNHVAVCPVCATEEETESKDTEKIFYEEDVVHNEEGIICNRCKKEL